jgi:hypothetical protein
MWNKIFIYGVISVFPGIVGSMLGLPLLVAGPIIGFFIGFIAGIITLFIAEFLWKYVVGNLVGWIRPRSSKYISYNRDDPDLRGRVYLFMNQR